MPSWLLNIIVSLGKPAFKALLAILEVKYPGLKPFIEAILAYLDAGGLVEKLHDHCETCPEFAKANDIRRPE